MDKLEKGSFDAVTGICDETKINASIWKNNAVVTIALNNSEEILVCHIYHGSETSQSPLARSLHPNPINMTHVMIKYSISYDLLRMEESEDVVEKCVIHGYVHNAPNVT